MRKPIGLNSIDLERFLLTVRLARVRGLETVHHLKPKVEDLCGGREEARELQMHGRKKQPGQT